MTPTQGPAEDPIETPCQQQRNGQISTLDGIASWGGYLCDALTAIKGEVEAQAQRWCGQDQQGPCCGQYSQLLDQLNRHHETVLGFQTDVDSIRAEIAAVDCFAEGWQSRLVGTQGRLDSLHLATNLLYDALTSFRLERDRLATACVQAVAPPPPM